jgi:class 3 adenylate cyclase
VTILWADIAGFTKMCQENDPKEIIMILKELFAYFDQLCERFAIFKLYTIGDSYVVMSTNDTSKRKDPGLEAINMVKMGEAMAEKIKDLKNDFGKIKILGRDFDLRIGVHTVYRILVKKSK